MNSDKKIVIAVWNSRSSWRHKTRLPFLHPMKLKDESSGLHASLLLYRAKLCSKRVYPFHKDMPRSALPEFEVLSQFRGEEIKCCESRGDLELKHPDIEAFDAYVNFLPEDQSIKSSGGIINGFKSVPQAQRSTSFDNEKGFVLNSASDPYEEAISEYFEYRHGRTEERQPDITIAIPVKTDTHEGLDYEKIQAWWAIINRSKTLKYQYLSQNCAFAVLQAMKAGGSEKFLKFESLFPVTPKRVGLYAKRISNQNDVNSSSDIYTIEKVLIYLINLVKCINNKPKPRAQTPLSVSGNSSIFEINKAIKDKIKQSGYTGTRLKAATILLDECEKTSFVDVKICMLKQVESLLADHVFFTPTTDYFSLISRLMVNIEKHQNEHLQLWYDTSELRKLTVELKKYGFSDRSKNRNAVNSFFIKHNSDIPNKEKWLELRQHLAQIGTKSYSLKIVNKIIELIDAEEKSVPQAMSARI